MSRIEAGNSHLASAESSEGSGIGRSRTATSASLHRIETTDHADMAARFEPHFRARRQRALSSITAVQSVDTAPLRRMGRDEMISRLSRIMVASRQSGGQQGDQIERLFDTMLEEQIRRLLLSAPRDRLEPVSGI